LEAIAIAVWERCGRSDSGTCVEDDPRNIAVAALAAVPPAPTDRAAVLRKAYEIAYAEGMRLNAMESEIGVGPYRGALAVAHLLRKAISDAQQERRTADEAQQPASRPAVSPQHRRALVHNAITDALTAAGDWVPLSIRIAATRAALAEVDTWHADAPESNAPVQQDGAQK
jgi:hypothetical protein